MFFLFLVFFFFYHDFVLKTNKNRYVVEGFIAGSVIVAGGLAIILLTNPAKFFGLNYRSQVAMGGLAGLVLSYGTLMILVRIKVGNYLMV